MFSKECSWYVCIKTKTLDPNCNLEDWGATLVRQGHVHLLFQTYRSSLRLFFRLKAGCRVLKDVFKQSRVAQITNAQLTQEYFQRCLFPGR